MDDPTRRCENDTDNETHSPRPPIPSGGLIFSVQSAASPFRLDVSNILEGDDPGTIVVLPAEAIIPLRLTS
jgi:hypothetical protein